MKTSKGLATLPKLLTTKCDDKALQTVEEICKRRGIRFTSIRRHILQLIWNHRSAVKAYDLLEEVKPYCNNAKPATVYRALDFLLEQGFIHKVMCLNAFIACRHFHCDDKRLLLICTQCHDIEERTTEKMLTTISNELQQSGFINQINVIEVQGLCTKCETQ